MLDTWLGDVTRARFADEYLGRAALARPGTVATRMFGWRSLARLLARGGAEVFVVASGELRDAPAPRTHAEVVELLTIGSGLFIRGAERADVALWSLAAGFAPELGRARVQIFATPGGTHGFRWHYDDEDVFIAQTAGIKDYYLRENTVAAAHPASGHAFGCFATETSPLQVATLAAGDFLYVPSRWWHMAECRQTALSLSIGLSRSAPGVPL